jgi:hypothetical protein
MQRRSSPGKNRAGSRRKGSTLPPRPAGRTPAPRVPHHPQQNYNRSNGAAAVGMPMGVELAPARRLTQDVVRDQWQDAIAGAVVDVYAAIVGRTAREAFSTRERNPNASLESPASRRVASRRVFVAAVHPPPARSARAFRAEAPHRRDALRAPRWHASFGIVRDCMPDRDKSGQCLRRAGLSIECAGSFSGRGKPACGRCRYWIHGGISARDIGSDARGHRSVDSATRGSGGPTATYGGRGVTRQACFL